MAGPIRTKHPTPPTSVVHAPRPPNAWIIYRSEKTKLITSGASGQPPPAQGVVSKMISTMWKAEPPETRAIYERRADEKKAEHQKQYPGYRFQPKKKEEKEAARVKRKQEKDNERLAKRTRPAARVTSGSVVPVTITNAAPVLYAPHTLYPQVDSSQSQQQVYAQYGPFGTSPPLSIASSPNEGSPLSDAAYPSDYQRVAQSSNNGVNLQACHASHSLVQSNDNDLFGTTSSSLMTSSVMTSTTTLSTQDWHSGQSSSSNTSVPLSFDIPPLPPQPWYNPTVEDSLQALLSATDDPSIFQVHNFDASSLNANPTGQLELSIGQIPTNYEADSYFGNSFNGLGFNLYGYGSEGQMASSDQPDFSFLSTDIALTDMGSFTGEEFITYDDAPSSVPLSSMPPTPSTQLQVVSEHEIHHPIPYVPPAGAVHSSNRRAAGSWKISAVPESPIEHNLLAWGVPAN
ncbi:hypothetical protein K443DRAFT_1017 [Laccaria amethystina LaAM-08-1]|uniref:HMG box domain-containing protein n=1 Tax=Laccaria amethystina LaAM-08-1 TaxID=1095629 RepID=A0A0C9YG44_9AGAR|nr:hypothetical protein K443DRAFT_1017 [Laccaria amethystina LaAM-08-1]